MLLIKVIEQITLVDDAVAVVLSLFKSSLEAGCIRPAASGRYKRERNSVAILCFVRAIFLLPITLHLYYTSARAGQQGYLRLGTLCLEVVTGHNRSYSPLFAGAGSPSACPARKARFRKFNFTPIPPIQSSMDFLPPAKQAIRSSRGEVSKVIPLTSGRDSGATAPMSTLFICSSSFAVNLTVKPPYQNRIRLPHIIRTQEGSTNDAALLPHSTLGHFVSKLVGAVFIMVLGFFQRFEIKYIMKLTNNPPNVLGRKTAVFHRVDYIPDKRCCSKTRPS